MRKPLLNTIASCIALLGAGHASAKTSAALTGFMGEKALLMINGSAPRVVSVGSSIGDVTIISLDRKSHSVQANIAGEITTLRLIGGQPSSYGSTVSQDKPAAAGGMLSIPKAEDGHFYTDGFINGHRSKFMVDTGSSSVVLGQADAQRMGIAYKEKGVPITITTANGQVPGFRIKLDSIALGDIEEKGVDAVVGPDLPFILLGNSFLSRLKMQSNNSAMLIESTR